MLSESVGLETFFEPFSLMQAASGANHSCTAYEGRKVGSVPCLGQPELAYEDEWVVRSRKRISN